MVLCTDLAMCTSQAALVCIGLYWSVLVCTGLYWFVLVCTGLYWSVLVCTGLYWFVLVCIGLYQSVLVCIGLYWSVWSVLVCTGLYWSCVIEGAVIEGIVCVLCVYLLFPFSFPSAPFPIVLYARLCTCTCMSLMPVTGC